MLRLLTILCAGLFLTLLLGGRDGAVRHGLMSLDARPATSPLRIATPSAPSVPAMPRVGADPGAAAVAIADHPIPETRAELAEATLADMAATPVTTAPLRAAAPAVVLPAGFAPAEAVSGAARDIRFVDASAINVREGPSTDHPVVGRLTRAEAVQVVAEAGDWVQVRVEGDGVEGYVAARLLSAAP